MKRPRHAERNSKRRDTDDYESFYGRRHVRNKQVHHGSIPMLMRRVVMSGKPYQSILIPYEDEIIALRHQRPPMPYAQIAELLQQKHNLIIQGNAIFKFVKVRSGGRKVYSYSRDAPEKKAATTPEPQVTASGP